MNLSTLIAARSDRTLESTIFGTADADDVAARVLAFASDHFGPVDEVRFYRGGTGLVVGLHAWDVGDVVVKFHRRNMGDARLRAAQRVQQQLAENGYPAPRPLLRPTLVAAGLATAETSILGESVDEHDPIVRAETAGRLHDFISRAASTPSGRFIQSSSHLRTRGPNCSGCDRVTNSTGERDQRSGA